MPDILTMHAAAHPEKPGVIEDGVVITYAEFEARANQVAGALQQLGVKAGTKLVWCAENSTEVVMIVSAARKAGAIAVPLNYRLSPEEAAYVIDNSDATVVLFDVEQAAQLSSCVASCPKITAWVSFHCERSASPSWAQHLPSIADSMPTSAVTPLEGSEGAGGTMIYTSGTTGKPKGALRRGGTNQAPGAALVQLIGYEPSDVYITTGPLYHSGPLGFMGIVLGFGGTVVVQRHFEAEEWLRLVDEHKVTTTFSAPTPVRRVVDLPEDVRKKYDYSSMKRFIANAAPWPFELKRKYVQAFNDTTLWEVYGSTELGVNTVLTPADQMRKPGSCGRPAPLVEVALFDEEGNRVTTPMEPGELYVQSASAFDTYYKAEEKYEASKRGDWLTVGDIAYFDDEGFLFICDRKNDMIISGGMNIYPAEIEAVLVAHPAIADAAVFGVPSDEWGESVHAAITLYPGVEVTDEEITAFAREHMASYRVPRGYTRIDEIPRSASGKILKKELRAPWWEGHATQVG
ncbi:MAG: long-chain acyl-CoA synthetase [Actinomycetota bacterium]|jgi:fatty-acyl-CoA synthase/long-chain acyl-CoA synthetase|nr:long-chain acyl-CoA synthetase [Actinomycetota bacterium]